MAADAPAGAGAGKKSKPAKLRPFDASLDSKVMLQAMEEQFDMIKLSQMAPPHGPVSATDPHVPPRFDMRYSVYTP
jgi:hypothetical protein